MLEDLLGVAEGASHHQVNIQVGSDHVLRTSGLCSWEVSDLGLYKCEKTTIAGPTWTYERRIRPV